MTLRTQTYSESRVMHYAFANNQLQRRFRIPGCGKSLLAWGLGDLPLFCPT